MKFKDIGNYDSLTKTAIIMRDGVYTYLAGEFPNIEGDPNKRLRVYRSPESVKKAYERFKELGKLPVIFEHPDEDLDLNDFSQGYGYEPEIIEEGLNLAIKCKLKLTDESLEAYEELGVREISCGWSGDFVEYKDKSVCDYEQTFEEFNHIALVPQGRCGTLCSIKDNKGALQMKKITDEQVSLFEKANKCTDEIASIAKESEEIEDSHAEGLLNAIKGLKEVIAGLEAFAQQENKEPEIKEEAKTEEEIVDEEPETEKVETVKVEEVKDEDEVEVEVEVEKDEEKEETEKVEDAKAVVLDAKTMQYLKARIKDATELGMKLASKRFHDVLPYIADGSISMADIEYGSTPCEIKQRFVEKMTGTKYTDKKELNVAFNLVAKSQFNDGWKGEDRVFASVLDEKAEAIASIGRKK